MAPSTRSQTAKQAKETERLRLGAEADKSSSVGDNADDAAEDAPTNASDPSSRETSTMASRTPAATPNASTTDGSSSSKKSTRRSETLSHVESPDDLDKSEAPTQTPSQRQAKQLAKTRGKQPTHDMKEEPPRGSTAADANSQPDPELVDETPTKKPASRKRKASSIASSPHNDFHGVRRSQRGRNIPAEFGGLDDLTGGRGRGARGGAQSDAQDEPDGTLTEDGVSSTPRSVRFRSPLETPSNAIAPGRPLGGRFAVGSSQSGAGSSQPVSPLSGPGLGPGPAALSRAQSSQSTAAGSASPPEVSQVAASESSPPAITTPTSGARSDSNASSASRRQPSRRASFKARQALAKAAEDEGKGDNAESDGDSDGEKETAGIRQYNNVRGLGTEFVDEPYLDPTDILNRRPTTWFKRKVPRERWADVHSEGNVRRQENIYAARLNMDAGLVLAESNVRGAVDDEDTDRPTSGRMTGMLRAHREDDGLEAGDQARESNQSGGVARGNMASSVEGQSQRQSEEEDNIYDATPPPSSPTNLRDEAGANNGASGTSGLTSSRRHSNIPSSFDEDFRSLLAAEASALHAEAAAFSAFSRPHTGRATIPGNDRRESLTSQAGPPNASRRHPAIPQPLEDDFRRRRATGAASVPNGAFGGMDIYEDSSSEGTDGDSDMSSSDSSRGDPDIPPSFEEDFRQRQAAEAASRGSVPAGQPGAAEGSSSNQGGQGPQTYWDIITRQTLEFVPTGPYQTLGVPRNNPGGAFMRLCPLPPRPILTDPGLWRVLEEDVPRAEPMPLGQVSSNHRLGSRQPQRAPAPLPAMRGSRPAPVGPSPARPPRERTARDTAQSIMDQMEDIERRDNEAGRAPFEGGARMHDFEYRNLVASGHIGERDGNRAASTRGQQQSLGRGNAGPRRRQQGLNSRLDEGRGGGSGGGDVQDERDAYNNRITGLMTDRLNIPLEAPPPPGQPFPPMTGPWPRFPDRLFQAADPAEAFGGRHNDFFADNPTRNDRVDGHGGSDDVGYDGRRGRSGNPRYR